MKQFTLQQKSWILYDVANSAFVLIVTTTLMPLFFKQFFVPAELKNQSFSLWAYGVSISSLLHAVVSPILGTIADYKNYKKRLLVFFMGMGVLSTFILAFIQEERWIVALTAYICAQLGFLNGNIFYDSFLTDVADRKQIDAISSHGFAWGYIGSVIPFIISIALVFLFQKSSGFKNLPPLAIRISFCLVAFWWFIFSLPLIRNVKHTYFLQPEPNPIINSFKRLFTTLKNISKHKNAFTFLLAYFLYIDAVYTTISMATAYGNELGLSTTMLIIIILFIQIVAWPFAILFGKLAEKTSTKIMIYAGLTVYFVIITLGFIMAYIPQLMRSTVYIIMAFLVATAQGGIQSLSRSMFGSLIPKENSSEFFGLYNVFGKFAAIVGPVFMGLFAQLTGKSHFGVLSLSILLLVSIIVFSRVRIKTEI